MKRLVGVNERGIRVGEYHWNSRLTDAEVDLLLELRGEHGWSYNRLAEKFEISKSAVRKICHGETRGQHPVRYKVVHIPD